MAHQVFISYANEDKLIADAVCKALEEGGVQCWYAPRDVPYAVDYEEAIVDAIAESKLMLLVLSSHSNDSKHVKREVQNASREEPQVPVLPFQIEDVALNKSLKYYIGSVHWLSALTPPLEDHLEKLVGYVQQRLPQGASSPAAAVATNEQRVETASVQKENANLASVRNRAEGEVPLKPKAEVHASPQQSINVSSVSAVTTDPKPGIGQWWGKRWMLFLTIACLVVFMVSALTWFRILRLSPFFVSRALVPVFIGLLTIPLVAILIKTKVTSEGWRPKLFFIIAGLTLLGLYALLFTGAVHWRFNQVLVVFCIAIFIPAAISFVRSASVPAPRLRVTIPLIITAVVVAAVFALTPEELVVFFSPLSKVVLFIGLAFLVLVVILFVRKTHALQSLKLVASLSVIACAAILLGMRVDREQLELTSIFPLRTAKENDAQGSVLFNQQKYAEAELYYRAAVRFEPTNPDYNNNLGTALYGLQRYAEAESVFQEAVRLRPTDPLLRANLADALYELRRYADAELQYSKARDLSPGIPRYENGVTKARAAMGNK